LALAPDAQGIFRPWVAVAVGLCPASGPLPRHIALDDALAAHPVEGLPAALAQPQLDQVEHAAAFVRLEVEECSGGEVDRDRAAPAEAQFLISGLIFV
jgi:hypothetical protein